MRRLLRVLETNPDCYIYYIARDKFRIYKERPKNRRPEYLESILLYEGSDKEGSKYFAPALVVALSTMIGLDCDSKSR